MLAIVTKGGDLAIGPLALPARPALALVSIGEALDVRIDSPTRAYVLARSGNVEVVDNGVKGEPATLNVIELNARGVGVDALHRDGRVSVLVGGKAIDVAGVTDAVTLFGTHCAHRRSNAIACWDTDGKAVAWRGPTNVVDRLESVGTTCTLASSGVACSGANEVSQLGTGPGPDRADPRIIPLAFVPTSIAAGDRAWCALADSGSVSCWGANDGGQLGVGSLVDGERPAVVSGVTEGATKTADSIAAGASDTPMSWDELPTECTKPTAVPSATHTDVPVASAYAYTRHAEWELWFADFALEPHGYRPGYAVARGTQLAVGYRLFTGTPGAPTRPIVRGRYQSTTPKQRANVINPAGSAPTDVLVELVTPEWICGTILDGGAKHPFAARIQTPRFP